MPNWEIIMKGEGLKQIKYVGAARMKFLHASGITTIKKLYHTPLENLSQIKGIGEHYAKLIKDSVTEIYGKKLQRPAPKTTASKKKKVEKINQSLKKQVRILIKRLEQVNENLKPLGKKKYLESYIDLKKKSKTLKVRLNAFAKKQSGLSNNDKKKIIKAAGVLDSTLKVAGKKPTKKNYSKVVKNIQSFSKMIK